MCGINGVLLKSFSSESEFSGILSRMNREIVHRGPDQDGFFSEHNPNFSLGMAMRRLSIIDLKTGRQPIFSKDGAIGIVFNGEIYNYKTLRSMLEKENIPFQTTSDTEVILKLYEVFGTRSFRMLDGMFAFSIYDRNLKKVFIARDFFGEKPLYCTQNDEGIYWGSELKSIISVLKENPEISLKGLNLYFRLTYIPAPFTIYKNIYKLEANHYMEIDCEKLSFQIHEIKQKFSENIDPQISFKEAKDMTHKLVNESVSSRSVSDVPIGTFLSGGVDSSIVSLVLSKQYSVPIDTFSIGFEKKTFDETNKSRTVAKLIHSNHHEFIVSVDDLKNNIDSILMNFDEPFADSSSLPTYIVAHKTSQSVKVALTGDGGDEVFGGYNKYYMGKMNSRYTSIIPQRFHSSVRSILSPMLSSHDDQRGMKFKIKKLLNAIDYDEGFYYNIISLGFQEEEIPDLLISGKTTPNVLSYFSDKQGLRNKTLTDFRNIDRLISLEGDMLVKVDRTSMLTSLESRAPFLNKTLWNFTEQLPESYLMKGWNKKFLLKEAFKMYFPEGFLDKSKKGFGIPVGDWLRDHLYRELKSYIDPELVKAQGIFNLPEIKMIVENHLSGKEDNTFKVWTFFCFQKWYYGTYQRSNNV